jgi:hypothetical protein
MMTRPSSAQLPRHSAHLLIAFGLAVVFGCGDTLDPLDPLANNDTPTFTSIYQADEFQLCKGCHAPGAPGRTEGIEATQDWSTRESARDTLRGSASGLIGNFEGCNGVPLLGGSAEQSLLVASLDETVRANFSNPTFPDCTSDSISLQTLKIMRELPAGLLRDLKDWIDGGAPGN